MGFLLWGLLCKLSLSQRFNLPSCHEKKLNKQGFKMSRGLLQITLCVQHAKAERHVHTHTSNLGTAVRHTAEPWKM